MRTAAIIGHFAKRKQDFGGQTIKTKTISEALQNDIGSDQVIEFDTHGSGVIKFLKAPIQAFFALRNCRNVIILPAQNALQVYIPLLYLVRKVFFKKRKIHYVVIGGWLPDFVHDRKRLSKILKQLNGIYVETNTMRKTLETQGFDNIFVLPNCKKLTVLSENDLVCSDNVPYKLCTFSRVSREKGIEDAVNAVLRANEDLGYTAFILDIYGQVDTEQTMWFEKLRENLPNEIRYCGVVSFEKSVDVLKEYFALLFPTYYDGEGFAGTLIDAFSAGVPVIATDWKYNAEIVNNDVGYLYPTRDQRAFIEILKSVANNPMNILSKKLSCLREAEKYEIGKAMKVLENQMQK